MQTAFIMRRPIWDLACSMALRLFYGWHSVCYELEFTTLLHCVAYATYVGVTLAAYIAYPSKSSGVQDCIYEDKTACSHGPDGAIRLREAPGGGGGITQMPLCWTEATEIEKRTAGRHTHTHTHTHNDEPNTWARSTAVMDRQRPQGACLRQWWRQSSLQWRWLVRKRVKLNPAVAAFLYIN